MPKRTAIGVVTSDKMQKTRRVEIPRLVQHATYGKIIRRRTICYAHDENNESGMGDKVEIVESRPRSRSKRWELVRIVEKFGDAQVAAMRAARETAAQDAATVSGEGTAEAAPSS